MRMATTEKLINTLPEQYRVALHYDKPLLVVIITGIISGMITVGGSIYLSLQCNTSREERLTVNFVLMMSNLLSSGATSLCLETMGTVQAISSDTNSNGTALFSEVVRCSAGNAASMAEAPGWPTTGGVGGGPVGPCAAMISAFEDASVADCPFPGTTLFHVTLQYQTCPAILTQVGAAMGYAASCTAVIVLLISRLLCIKKIREPSLVEKGSFMRELQGTVSQARADATKYSTSKVEPE